eukprot:gene12243-3604_t
MFPVPPVPPKCLSLAPVAPPMAADNLAGGGVQAGLDPSGLPALLAFTL